MRRKESNDRDLYLTAFTDLNAAIFFARERLQEAEKVVERELMRRIAGSDHAFVCERCGEVVWVEIAEGDVPILVENDGRPHEDRCKPQKELFDGSGKESSRDEAAD